MIPQQLLDDRESVKRAGRNTKGIEAEARTACATSIAPGSWP